MKDHVQIPKKLIEKTSGYFEKMRATLFDEGDTEKIAVWIKRGFAALAPTIFSVISDSLYSVRDCMKLESSCT